MYVSENNKSVTKLATIDDVNGSINYSVTDGLDKDLFEVNATSGSLSFVNLPNKILPDYENPEDDDSNNVYEVEVTVTDEEVLT